LLEADFACADIRKSSKGDWAIVVGPPELVGRHPRRRLVYVHPILGLDEIARHIDNETQTLAMMPVEAARPWRDAWALRGATRIVELGLNNVFRLGSAHDCMYPMQRMVRFVSQDSPAHVHPKGITFDIDQTRLLNEDRFLELIT
jgi:long-chain-fatty-acyl-CoA reductase